MSAGGGGPMWEDACRVWPPSDTNAKNAAAVWGRALAVILRGQSREEKFYVEKFLPSTFFFLFFWDGNPRLDWAQHWRLKVNLHEYVQHLIPLLG